MKITKIDLLLLAPIYLQLMYWTFEKNKAQMLLANGVILVVLFVIAVIYKVINYKKTSMKK